MKVFREVMAWFWFGLAGYQMLISQINEATLSLALGMYLMVWRAQREI